jgi:hypothetical protein
VADRPGGWHTEEQLETARRLGEAWAKLPRRDPARIDRIIAKLVELWRLQPDQRLGQLVVNVMRSQGRILELPDVQLLEDDQFERLLDADLERARARTR